MKTKTVNWSSYRIVFSAVVFVALLASAGTASAQAIIKVNDTVNLRFGILMQDWADWQQTQASGATTGYAQNLYIRRFRILMAGTVAKNVTFFMETDNANLGKAPKALGTGFFLQDAFLNWKIANEFSIDAGLILIPLCRNCTESAITQLVLDYGSFSFLESGVTQSTVGRDTGFQARGYLAGNRLEYRAGAYQGIRQAGSHNSFRFTGRLQYNFLDTEVGPFYAGNYLGKKKVFALGASYDTQSAYKAYSVDGFLSLPVAGKNGLTGEFDYIHYDGGETFTTLLKQNTIMGQVGFLFAGPELMPFFRYESQSFTDDVNKKGNSRNIHVGLGWFPHGHWFNIKAAYTNRQKPNDSSTANTSEFTLQLQLAYF